MKASLINIALTSRYSAGSYAFAVKDCVHCFRRRRSSQVHSFMAALTCLRSVEAILTLTCPSPKSFVYNLPDSGRRVTSVFQVLSLARTLCRAGRREPWEWGWLPIWFPIHCPLKKIVCGSWKVLKICLRASKRWLILSTLFPVMKIFDRWGDVLICVLINTSTPSHWLKSVTWPVGPVLKFRDIPDWSSEHCLRWLGWSGRSGQSYGNQA